MLDCGIVRASLGHALIQSVNSVRNVDSVHDRGPLRQADLPVLPLAQGDPLRVETVRDQLGHCGLHVSLVRHGQIHLPVHSELRQGLSARPTWPNEPVTHLPRDGDGPEFPVSLGYGAAYGSPLGADGEAVGNVLHVAASDDGSFGGEECGAHGELAVGTVGVLTSGEAGVDEPLHLLVWKKKKNLLICFHR